MILGRECCEQPGYFSNTLVAHKAPTVHRVGNWDKKISQDFPDWMPNPLWTVWNARLCWFLITRRNSKCCTIASLMLPGHPLGKLRLLLEPKLFLSSFSRSYLILVNLFPLCWWSELQADVPLCSHQSAHLSDPLCPLYPLWSWMILFSSHPSAFLKINVSISLPLLTHSWSPHWPAPTNWNMSTYENHLLETQNDQENIWIIR